jgi:hypothetical protein
MSDKIIKIGANYVHLDGPDDVDYQVNILSIVITLTIVGIVVALGTIIYCLMKGV